MLDTGAGYHRNSDFRLNRRHRTWLWLARAVATGKARRLISRIPNWKGIRQGIFQKQASCQLSRVQFAN
jgi:hypothetical protein